MDVIGERTEYVFGRSVEAGGSGILPRRRRSASTTASAPASQASSDRLTPSGRIIVVQGSGAVGPALADQLADAGSSVLVADIDFGRTDTVAKRVGGAALPVDQVFETDCDVYAPCAVGGTLRVESVGPAAVPDCRRLSEQPARRAGCA
jgi:leucine dehydrogenase